MNRAGLLPPKYERIIAVLACLLVACSSPPAPIEERSTTARSYSLNPNGRYVVRRGDTLYSISFNYGVDWKDVAKWNAIARPYTIYPGQELVLVSPRGSAPTAAGTTIRPMGQSPTATTRPLEPKATVPGGEQAKQTPTTRPPTQAAASAPAPATQTPGATPQSTSAAPGRWLWPTGGTVASSFKADDPSRKGIDISGKEGQEVIAAAAGEVVYSGNGLIGFGELIIIKHNESMLTAYAHNSRRLVQEGEQVAAGARIAEMGRNERDQALLHFELRVNGKPVDPLKYLPPR